MSAVGRRLGRRFGLCGGLALGLLVSAAAAAEPGGALCPTPSTRDAAGLEAARACILALERRIGPDAPELGPELSRLGAAFAREPATADGALYFLRRARRLALATDGAESLAAAEAALALARASILSGRCTAQDPNTLPLLDAAAAGFRSAAAAPDAARAGLLATAAARADLLDFAGAAALLAATGPADAAEWERLGDWRRRSGDLRGAADAWAEARARAPAASRTQARLTTALRRLYFELGDAGAAAALD